MSPLLSSRFIFIAVFRQVSPFLPPSFSPLAGPLPHCYAGRVGPEKFPRRSPNFVLPAKARVGWRRRRAGAAQGSGRAAGSTPAPAEFAGRTEASSATAAGAPGPSVAKCSRSAGEDEEALRCPRPGSGCRNQPPAAALSSRGPSERAESGSAEGTGLPRGRLLAGPQALCCIRPGHRNPLAPARRGAPRRPPARAESIRKATARRRRRERASEREPGRKPPGQGGGTRARRELRAE